ncbi:hypothetical protein IW261DRAFT_1637204 [Armillaria novae-zelandiae]|uniref:Uncharacterized protein n=1 Tax=Armillaria novae-zelandiae TaxID=153914 RepID=A0AA39U8A6_9AGAR|nr:hypothetical protein IW261DRAFT_1637204 [Armillaria novae-zelandiae]
MAARYGYTPVTALEDATNSFVEIASALIHDCIVGIERGGTAFSNREILVSLSIHSTDLHEQQCLSRLAEHRDRVFEGKEVLDQLRHALRHVSEEWSHELAWRGHVRRRDFHLRFNEFVWEVRQRLDAPAALRGHRDRIRAFLGVRTRVGVSNGARVDDRREAAVLYDTLQGLDALLHGRHNHGDTLPRLVSLDQDSSHSEELIMARDVICGILPGPSILTFETAVRKFFVPLLATRTMARLLCERRELGQLCERVAYGERQALDALDEARRTLQQILQSTPSPQPQTPARRRHDPVPYRTRYHDHHLHWCHDCATPCRFHRRRETTHTEPHRSQSPATPTRQHYPPFNPFLYSCQPQYRVTPCYSPPSPVIPPDLPPFTSHTPNGQNTVLTLTIHLRNRSIPPLTLHRRISLALSSCVTQTAANASSNPDSLIYGIHLPRSTRTLTCHVDLVDATKDTAQEPYTTLSSLPNYIGFRKCFPNLTRIFLEVRYYIRCGFSPLILHDRSTVRTRISITLDQATTQLGVLPVDWEITTDDLEPEYIHGDYADHDWRMFLWDARIAMAPATLSKCIEATPLKDLLSHSTYVNRVMRFSGHGVHTERSGDVRAVNRRFGKAARVSRPFSEIDSFFFLWARFYLY